MHEVLVNRLGGLSLPRKSVVRLTDRPDMTLDVYRGRKTTMQQQQQPYFFGYKTEFYSFQNSPKNLDASYKTDLDIWDCLGRVKLTYRLIESFVVVLERRKPHLIAE